MSHCVNTLAADQYAAAEGRRTQDDIYRERRQEQIADALLAGNSVFDGRSSWFQFNAYEYVDAMPLLEAVMRASSMDDFIEARAAIRKEYQTAANIVAARIVDDVIAWERHCREGDWDED